MNFVSRGNYPVQSAQSGVECVTKRGIYSEYDLLTCDYNHFPQEEKTKFSRTVLNGAPASLADRHKWLAGLCYTSVGAIVNTPGPKIRLGYADSVIKGGAQDLLNSIRGLLERRERERVKG